MEERTITRSLNWVDEVLPVFTDACRFTLHEEGPEIIQCWQDWVDRDSFVVIGEAGKGKLFEWRRAWLRRLLALTSLLKGELEEGRASSPTVLASSLLQANANLPLCFPEAFWHDVVSYLRTPMTEEDGTRRKQSLWTESIPFPLLLSEPVVDGGTETSVILAEFCIEQRARHTGGVFLDPRQAVVRCMDASFGRVFTEATVMAQKAWGAAATSLPDISIRLRTVKPGHERFLSGTVLTGPSGGGALALSLVSAYTGQVPIRERFAVSIALAQGQDASDGTCYPVGGSDDKVRGCAKQGIQCLLVAHGQADQLASYAYRHGIEAVGVATFGEACNWTLGPPWATCETSGIKEVVLIQGQDVEPHASIARMVETRLAQQGYRIFSDRHLLSGIARNADIIHRLLSAHAVILLLSRASLRCDLLADAVEAAFEVGGRREGRPLLLPVRIDYTGPLPERIGSILAHVPNVFWEGDDERLLVDLEGALESAPPPKSPADSTSRLSPEALEPFDGVVPLGSRFYVAREVDEEIYAAVDQRHSILLVKGPRQVGKSSLLARALNRARSDGMNAVVTDFQKLSVLDLSSPQSFYLALGRMLARQLGIRTAVEDVWVSRRSPNLNFEEYMEDHVLPAASPLFWAIDEADRLFLACEFSGDVFGLFRSWANERQGKVVSPWAAVSMAIVYATEAHLFIKDMNQSPFNIGTRFELQDFTLREVAEVNERYDRPLSDAALSRLYRLVGGHPYLLRRGLYTIARQRMSIEEFEACAERDDGPLGDHLRRILTLLLRQEEHCVALKGVLQGLPCPSYEAFYHLRTAGVLTGPYPQEGQLRCRLYENYLRRHLLAA